MKHIKNTLGLMLTAMGVLGTISATADVVGYWRFEEGTSGVDIVTAVSKVNAATLNATQSSGNGINTAVQYSNVVGGQYVYDPVLNSYTLNTRSMLMPIGGNPDGSGANSGLTAVNSQGSVLTTSPGDWTFETFVRIQDADGNLTGGNIASISGIGRWTPAFYADGRLRLRVNTADENGSVITASGVDVLDGEWHHLAYTIDFDSGANETTLSAYLDYGTPVSQTIAGQFVPYASADLNFGRLDGSDGEYNMFFDETRLSNAALESSQFLQFASIPEPGTLCLIALGLSVSAVRRWTGHCRG